ncbi:hypothetical protein STTU_2727 [Streptomyces sp. Tu6071]|nr:hypothetical protein STTU_2727 [Streptomyces sp. Tu6071]
MPRPRTFPSPRRRGHPAGFANLPRGPPGPRRRPSRAHPDLVPENGVDLRLSPAPQLVRRLFISRCGPSDGRSAESAPPPGGAAPEPLRTPVRGR